MGGEHTYQLQRPSDAVLEAVADEKGIDERDLDPPLFEAIDPDALDSLFRDTMCEVTFTYDEYVVTVDQANEVEVRAAETR